MALLWSIVAGLLVFLLTLGSWLLLEWAIHENRLQRSAAMLSWPFRMSAGAALSLVSWSYLRRVFESCPACGCRRKEMKFSEDARVEGSPNDQGLLANRCIACGAKWLGRPDNPWEKWRVRVQDSVFQEEEKPTLRSVIEKVQGQ